jgi:iron complex transport system substrate-binding protein
MGQSQTFRRVILCALLAVVVAWFTGCKRSPTVISAAQRPVVASLVPAATDLILCIGAGDHLAGISNFDHERPELAGLPRVGDYQSVDWERLELIRPQILFIFQKPDRIPEGMRQKADALGIRLINVRTERLEDVFSAMKMLGHELNEPAKADASIERLRNQLDRVRRRVAGLTPVKTLFVFDTAARNVVGPDTWLDDLLTIAGGQNVASEFNNRYPEIDPEKLKSLAPQAIIQLLPDATPQVLQQAKQRWESLNELAAVKNNRLITLTDWYIMQPGCRVGDLAEQFADFLHPQPSNGNAP